MNVIKLTTSHKLFPKKLKQIHSVPASLYVLGDIKPLLSLKTVSIVGSRSVTPYGRMVTEKFAYLLASKGVGIVSGLALGVDAIAHKSALDAGGYTIAVLPSAVDNPYPATNRQLAKQIVSEGGALVSEYEGEMQSFRSNFIARNRLVAGLGDAVLITEASDKSGTIHTANFALDQGKTVMAVPGNITSPNSRGTNNLIKSGALPVTEAEDILSVLGIDSKNNQQLSLPSNKEEASILTILQSGVSDVNELQTKSGLSSRDFNQHLTMLELSGKIKPLGGGHWSIT
jgi:DNA processing protein